MAYEGPWWPLVAPFFDPASRTFWPGLVVFVVVSFLVHRSKGTSYRLRDVLGVSLWTHRSSKLDAQLYLSRQFLEAVKWWPSLAGSWWLATHLVRQLDGAFGVPTAPNVSPWVASLLYTAVLFIVWDFSRYVLHRLMHAVPALWAFHQVHHSAEVLTPLTFHRLHPMESVAYQVRNVLATGVVTGVFFWLFRGTVADVTFLGVHALGLIFNVVAGNLRHSHVWIGFGRAEALLISPAQHQLHHSVAPEHYNCNYGTWLSVWDRLGGTLLSSEHETSPEFGLEEGTQNHEQHLLSAWLHPFRASLGLRAAPTLLALFLLTPSTGHTQDRPEESDETSTKDADYEVIVYSEDGVPQVVGSAHTVEEKTLETFEHNDIHRVVEKVPGVYVRDEDGFGLRPNIGIRGANSDRSAKITLMEDGVVLAPAPYAAPAAYYFPMTTRLVGVEVSKGPSSIQYGPHTVGGAINLKTRDVPEAPAAAADLSYGSYQTRKVHTWGGTSGTRGGVLFEAVHVGSDGFKVLDTGGDTGFERSEGMLKARLNLSEGISAQALELKLGYASERSEETYLGLTADDLKRDPYRRYPASAEGLMVWNRTQAQLAWDAAFGRTIDLRTVAYHHGFQRAWTKLNRFADGSSLHDRLLDAEQGQNAVFMAILRGDEDSVSPEQQLLIGTNDRRFEAMGVQSQARWLTRGEHLEHELEVGLRYHIDNVTRLHTEAPFNMTDGALERAGDETLTTLDRVTQAKALATHVHDVLAWKGLQLHSGVRVESIQTRFADDGATLSEPIHRSAILPGGGLLLQGTPWLQTYVGLHQGFSPVAPGQDEDVKAESSWNYEGGVRLGRDVTRLDVGAFFNDYSNLTGQCSLSGGCTGDQVDQQYNGGEVDISGLETFATHTIMLPNELKLPIMATWTWTHSRFQTAFQSGFSQFGRVNIGDVLPYVPQHQASLTVGIEHPKFQLHTSAHQRTMMLDAAGTWEDATATTIPGLLLIDMAASAILTERLSVYATATNLLDEQQAVSWRPAGARPNPPRQLYLGVRGDIGKASIAP